MSKVKHTPGPWEIEFDPWHFDTASTVVGGEKVKAKGIGQQMLVQVGGWASPTEQEANARLIATAPELLEALEELLAVAPAHPPAAGLIVGIEERHSLAIKRARAAIAKAMGD